MAHRYNEKFCNMFDISTECNHNEDFILDMILIKSVLVKHRYMFDKDITDDINMVNKTIKTKFSENSLIRYIQSSKKTESIYDKYVCIEPTKPIIVTNIEIIM